MRETQLRQCLDRETAPVPAPQAGPQPDADRLFGRSRAHDLSGPSLCRPPWGAATRRVADGAAVKRHHCRRRKIQSMKQWFRVKQHLPYGTELVRGANLVTTRKRGAPRVQPIGMRSTTARRLICRIVGTPTKTLVSMQLFGSASHYVEQCGPIDLVATRRWPLEYVPNRT
jgi:hypothetical protein